MSKSYASEPTAAMKLANYINLCIPGASATSVDVRILIEKYWSRIALLAHTIHEETIACQNALETRERAELRRLKEKYES